MANDEKELAEHVMLVDLGRNDVGQVSEFGSVDVTEFKKIEKYSHVMHIVSNVRGKLRAFIASSVNGSPAQIVELSADDYTLLLDVLPFLEHIGFVVKEFSKNTVVIEGVPSGIKIGDDEKVLLNMLDEYKRGKGENLEIRDNVAKSYACHSAIRAGEPLTLEAMNALIDQLFSTNEPYFCPHGRPVIINLTLDELDRRFRRH